MTQFNKKGMLESTIGKWILAVVILAILLLILLRVKDALGLNLNFIEGLWIFGG